MKFIDWEKEYKKETGKSADYRKEPYKYPGRMDYYYYDNYVEWLENKLTEAIQQAVNVKENIETILNCPYCHHIDNGEGVCKKCNKSLEIL